MSFPTPIIEFGFVSGASTGTYLTLDDTARGKLNTGTLAPDDVWIDLSSLGRSFTCRRGSTRVDGPILHYEAGTASIVMDDTAGDLDPTNLSGAYVSAGATQVVPMVGVRIRATHNGTTYNIWRGNADRFVPGYHPADNLVTSTCEATDPTKVLAGISRMAVAPVGAGELSGARVNRILDSLDWDATARSIDTGNSTLQATTLEGKGWDELQLVADSELGEIYLDASGRVVFRDRHASLDDARSNTSQATFGDSGSELRYRDVSLDYDDTTLINRALITRVGGAVQQSDDTASQVKYLIRTAEESDIIVETDAAALSYAQWLVYQGAEPELRFSQLVLTRLADNTEEDTLFAQMLGRDIGDRITIVRRPPNRDVITRDVFIRGIEHDVSPEQWKTTFTLQSATKYSFLTLNNSVLGKLDNNALAF